MKIFISAVSSQFKECRTELASKLRNEHTFVKIQEDFAQGDLLLQELENYIKSCDLFIAIIGNVYGAEPPIKALPQIWSHTRRSYTQWEYYFALGERLLATKGIKKNVKVYLASDQYIKNHHVDEAEHLKKLQQDFITEIENSNKHYNVFDDKNDLIAKVLHSFVERSLNEKIRYEFPTILAELYFKFIEKKQPRNHIKIFNQIINILSNIWTKDIEQAKDSKEIIFHLNEESNKLLKVLLYCYENSTENIERLIIPQFINWFKDNKELLVMTYNKFEYAIENEDDENMEEYDPNQSIKFLEELYKSLIFISEEFLFIGFPEDNQDKRKKVSINRAIEPIIETLEIENECIQFAKPDNEFLLTLRNKKALLFKSTERNFPSKLYKLFTDESWNYVRRSVIPVSKKQLMLDKNIILTEEIINPGYHTLIYRGYREKTKDGKTLEETQQLCICFLQDKKNQNNEIRKWFTCKVKLWQKLIHPQIIKVVEAETGEEHEVPFYTLDYYKSYLTLKQKKDETDIILIQNNLFNWIKTLIDICIVAHNQNIAILSFPTRHLLIGANGELLLTGFDTICEKNNELPDEQTLRKTLRDYKSLAPELKKGNLKPQQTADVWAIGDLIKKLFDECQESFKREIKEKMNIFLYHCNTNDSEIRFQTINQMLYFFNKLFISNETLSFIPETIELNNNLKIGKFPITNYEFDFFCRNTSQFDKSIITPSKYLPLRFDGPLLPVVGINRNEALKYCKWLTRKTGKNWRLPTEKEWIKASKNIYNEASMSANKNELLNSGYRLSGTSVVGSFSECLSAPNCFDMIGNVWDWCLDKVSDKPFRILKGGSFKSSISSLNEASTKEVLITYRSIDTGFRVVCEE
jgi:hypothetical protein